MIRWLRTLVSPPKPRPAPTVLPTPSGWQPPEPTEAEMAVVVAFLNRPDRKARREAVIRALSNRLDGLLLPMGFARDGKGWVWELPAGRASVAIRRFSGGVDATLVLGLLPKRKPMGINADRLSMQLQNFVQMSERTFVRDGSIDYAFADHDASTLDFPLAILRDRALPWVLAHGKGGYPDWRLFQSRPLSQP